MVWTKPGLVSRAFTSRQAVPIMKKRARSGGIKLVTQKRRAGVRNRRPHAPCRAGNYLLCVSVVVVVVGPGIEVEDEVVVELWVESDAQPDMNARAATAMQDRMICFIIGMVIWLVTVQSMIAHLPLRGHGV
jgi:hypothetical protein